MNFRNRIISLVIFFFISAFASAQKSPASESDLKRQAEKLFEKEDYVDATPMYSQLLSLYPKDPIYNYRYGICLLLSGLDKTGAAGYLEAAAKSKDMDPDVNFYLGRSYMYMDHYNEAISAFTLFKKNGSAAKQGKLQPDTYIHNCENANNLRMARKNVVVLSRTKVNRSTFFASYDFTNAAGKLLTTPDRFLTTLDKSRMTNPVMFMANDGETIYYASYGKKGEHGKDIYRIIKLPDGSWSEPLNLGTTINTDDDEDYPYLDKDGRTLYFSSRDHQSMGGYDIFKTQYNFNTGNWSEPENLGIPVNTVDDDIFFVPSTKGETATYATAVECENGKIELLSVSLGTVISNSAVITGTYLSLDQVTRRDARITVIRKKDNGVVTSVKTDRTGQYELVLPAGEDYQLLVEGGSYLPHMESFSVPAEKNLSGMQQRVVMNKSSDKEEMTMSNYFTPSPADANVASSEKPTEVVKSAFELKDTVAGKMLPVTFEGKTLYVASNEIRTLAPGSGNDEAPGEKSGMETSAVSAGKNTVAGKKNQGTEAASKNATQKNTNAELVKMAFDDAVSLKEEAQSIREDAAAKRKEAVSLDSLSKAQVSQANSFLVSGDKDQAQQVFKESKENAEDAIQKTNEAQAMESDAHARDTESVSSYKEALQLMKEFRVDTTSSSYHLMASGEDNTLNNPGTDSQNGNDSLVSNEDLQHAEDSSLVATNENQKDDADTLLLQSLEMEQRAENATDKSQKEFYTKKSKEAKHQSDLKKAGSTEANTDQKKNTSVKDEIVSNSPIENQQPSSTQSAVDHNINSGKTNDAVAVRNAANPGETASPGNVKNGNENSSVSPESNPAAASETKNDEALDATPAPAPIDLKMIDEINSSTEAKEHFKNYVQNMQQSKQKETEAKNTERKLLMVSAPEKRDSLERKSSDLNQSSIREWQVAQQELSKAKEADPEIEEKAGAERKSEAQGNTALTQTENKNKTSSSAAAVDHASSKNLPESGKEVSANAAQPGHTTSENPVRVNQPEVLDTTRPEYPQYVAVQKEILQKQTETVNVFVEGMKLNKQAVAMKQDEMKLRDSAEVSSDKKNKAKLTEKADSIAMEEDIVASHSRELLTSAQKNTGSVKELAIKSEKLKENLIVQPVAEQSGEKTLAPEQKDSTVEANTATKSISDQSSGNETTQAVPPADTPSQESTADVSGDSTSGKAKPESNEPASVQQISLAKNQADTGKTLEQPNIISKSNNTGSAVVSTDTTKAGQTKTETDHLAATNTHRIPSELPYLINHSLSGRDSLASAPDSVSVTELISADTSVALSASSPAPEKSNATITSSPSSETKQPAAVNESAKPSADIKTTEKGTPLIFENEITDVSTFSLGKGDAYSSSNPIPIDPSLPEGLVFKVQIGAFKNKLPDNTFRNLQPLTGETTRPGWIRYCLGLFRTFEPANLLKKEVRTMGYPDAFVVAYYNGKRIPLYDAYSMISRSDVTSRKTYATFADREFAQLAKFEISKSSFSNVADDDSKAFYGTAEVVPAGKIEYAVQVGVYKSSRIPSALQSLVPLNIETTATGFNRFTTGRFESRSSADSMKRVARGAGVKDAFVVIYHGGKKAGTTEAQRILSAHAAPAIKTAAPENAVTSADTEIKSGDIIFKIQLGAFRENVPLNAVNAFLLIADKGISQETDSRGLHIFYAGQFSDLASAAAAKEEIVSKGIKDAFIVAFVKGKRTQASEAARLLNHN